MTRLNRQYTVVENAGYVGEADVFECLTRAEAIAFIRGQYDRDEIESLHVAIRTDFADGSSEYQS